MTEAYVWVSTAQQGVDKQRYGVLASANTRGLGPLQCVEETASGRLACRERAVGCLLTATTQGGDVVLCAEMRRMARSTLQVLEMLATLHAAWRPRAYCEQGGGVPHERVDVCPNHRMACSSTGEARGSPVVDVERSQDVRAYTRFPGTPPDGHPYGAQRCEP